MRSDAVVEAVLVHDEVVGHALCNGMVARRAATYPFRLCRAILAGFRKQLLLDGILRHGAIGMQYVGEGESED